MNIDCEKVAIGLALFASIFISSTVYFAYWAYKLQYMLIKEWDEREGKSE